MQEEKFGTRLNRVLTLKNMKPVELSRKTGIPKPGISQYLSNRCVPKGKNLTIIAEVLNVSIDYLLGRTSMQNPKEYLENLLSGYNLTRQEYNEIIGDLINNRRFDLFLLDIDNASVRKQKIHSDVLKVYFDYLSSSGIAYTEENFDPEKAQKEQEPINDSFIELLKSLDKNKIIVDGNSKINENKLNVAFSSGYDGLNETNKNIIMEHIQFLTSQQNKNNNKKD